MSLLESIAAGVDIYDLAQPLISGMPCAPSHPGFRMALLYRHGDSVREDGGSGANELITTGGHVGTHVDALAHISFRGELHGGVSASEAQRGGFFRQLGIDKMEPIVSRGVLFDIAGLKGVDVLPAGYGITVQDLEDASQKFGITVRQGDVALVRSGWARYFKESEKFMGHESGVPGPTEEAARWLADQGVRATGSDTIAYEQILPKIVHRRLPVHRLLLFERGIHIIELMNLEEIAAKGIYKFLFFLSPLKIVGATGSPVRPLAVVER